MDLQTMAPFSPFGNALHLDTGDTNIIWPADPLDLKSTIEECPTFSNLRPMTTLYDQFDRLSCADSPSTPNIELNDQTFQLGWDPLGLGYSFPGSPSSLDTSYCPPTPLADPMPFFPNDSASTSVSILPEGMFDHSVFPSSFSDAYVDNVRGLDMIAMDKQCVRAEHAIRRRNVHPTTIDPKQLALGGRAPSPTSAHCKRPCSNAERRVDSRQGASVASNPRSTPRSIRPMPRKATAPPKFESPNKLFDLNDLLPVPFFTPEFSPRPELLYSASPATPCLSYTSSMSPMTLAGSPLHDPDFLQLPYMDNVIDGFYAVQSPFSVAASQLPDDDVIFGQKEDDHKDEDYHPRPSKRQRRSSSSSTSKRSKTKAKKAKSSARSRRRTSRHPDGRTNLEIVLMDLPYTMEDIRRTTGPGGVTILHCPFPDCSQTTTSEGDLGRHLESSPHATHQYMCLGCLNAFAREDSMTRHQKNQDKAGKAQCAAKHREVLSWGHFAVRVRKDAVDDAKVAVKAMVEAYGLQ